jgi:hypothetical protein
MGVCACVVKFKERGSEYTVEVLAESAYEACVLALHKFGRNRYLRGPGRHSTFELTVTDTKRYTIKVGDVMDWLYNSPGHSEAQREKKKYLKTVLAEDRR